MKKLFAILLSTALLASLLAVCTISVGAKTWEDDQVVGEDGNYTFDNAYGYVFNINAVDGVIGGEDNVLITNSASYLTANPNWAISVFLVSTDADGVYEVLSVVSAPANVPVGETWDINTIWPEGAELCLIAHSAYSNPNGTNWQSKVAAVALEAGDLIAINSAKTTATVSNEDGTFPAVDDTSKEPETSAPGAELVLENLALGASYTTSQLYQQGGADTEYGWDANAAITYPDEEGKSLTDGTVAAEDANYSDAVWAGFHAKAPDYVENGYSFITIDLGAVKSINDVVVHAGSSALGGGIGVPATVEVLVSEDGENFTSVNTVTPTDTTESNVVAITIDAVAEAQYVQVRMTSGGWMFVSEVEVEGYVEVENNNSSTTAPAGDASNMIVFAVIALVAIAGTAVVIKSR